MTFDVVPSRRVPAVPLLILRTLLDRRDVLWIPVFLSFLPSVSSSFSLRLLRSEHVGLVFSLTEVDLNSPNSGISGLKDVY